MVKQSGLALLARAVFCPHNRESSATDLQRHDLSVPPPGTPRVRPMFACANSRRECRFPSHTHPGERSSYGPPKGTGKIHGGGQSAG